MNCCVQKKQVFRPVAFQYAKGHNNEIAVAYVLALYSNETINWFVSPSNSAEMSHQQYTRTPYVRTPD